MNITNIPIVKLKYNLQKSYFYFYLKRLRYNQKAGPELVIATFMETRNNNYCTLQKEIIKEEHDLLLKLFYIYLRGSGEKQKGQPYKF